MLLFLRNVWPFVLLANFPRKIQILTQDNGLGLIEENKKRA